ncbi:hypothetical protein [Staphylococcus coagulans]|uniref:hypothetical protein n=1 Tax=Staphylococcus coagulans TaxID=74706 RepID=UPI00067A25CB|nr:hypothetical protein [Staphylococcus coagulans]AKS67946.1 hypothetical protein LH95_11005 [Staphylococcus schleiferi]MBA8765129.1 hypothetical protein [Staphylococcus coagulans]MBA8774626.1 hypothetical protein [Staphylococcus coagulans]MBT2810652.1 hypothetical protein [Staphylococcus coagulans]MBT2811734.1 hypothetical protein [Staphylococcus coagulans]
MAKKPKKTLSLLSGALSGASIIVDAYNTYIYRSKNKKLSYISIGIGVADVLLDFYLSFGAKSKAGKAWSMFSIGRQVYSSVQKLKDIQARS